MGIVYCAYHLHLGRRDAVKVLSPNLVSREDFRKRFIRESRLAAAINHPNIVTVYSAGEADGQLYIAMQYIDGCDLHTLRRAERILSPERVLAIVEQIGSALDAAHARGLVHRDVKPGNILVDEERAYLGDFGLTKSREITADSAGTEPGRFLGTGSYSAPEQIAGGEIDGRTDQYALACVVYECLTAEVPYPRDKLEYVLFAHVHDPPPRLTAKRPDLPEAVDAVIEKGLAKAKEDRYASCREFYEALSNALDVEPAPAPASTPPSRRLFPPADPDAPTYPDGAPVRSRLRALPTWVALPIIAAIALTVVLASSGGSSKKPNTIAPPPEKRKAKSEKPAKPTVPAGISLTTTPVGKRPFGLTVTGESVWVTAFNDDAIRRVDARTGQARGDLTPVGDGPFAVRYAKGFLWVALNHDDAIVRVDPLTGLATRGKLPVCNGPVNVQPAAGSIWVVCENDDTVARVDPGSGRVLGKTVVGDLPRGVAATRGVLWVSDRRTQAVSRLSTATGQLIGRPIPVGRDPQALAVVRNEVWVTDHGDDTVTRISVRTGRVIGRPIRVGSAPFGIAYGLGYVWVADSGSSQVTRIDPRTARVVGGPIPVGKQPSGLVVGDGAVWVSDNDGNALTRITAS